MHFVYILRTSDNRLYIGISQDLGQRLKAHNQGRGSLFTRVHSQVQMVYSESHSTLAAARKREIQLKKWSRAKKETLIAGEFNELRNLSRSHD